VGRTDDSPRGPLEPTVPDAHADAARAVALVVVVGLVFGLAAWLISPRFELDTPSLVDDWSAISRSSDQLRDVFLLTNPEEQRYRPGWIVWNALQWNTFDAPGGMAGPNFWNLLRALILVAGLTLATSLLLPSPRTVGGALLHAALAASPAFLVVTVPKFTVDLTRFGPQEPLLVGAMALGGALLVLAARALLDPPRVSPPRTATLGVAGAVFWALGVYQKEASLAVVPLLVAVLFAGRRHLSTWARLGRRRQVALAALGAVVALPLGHMLVQTIVIVLRGDLVYGAEVDAGETAVEGLAELWDWAHEALPDAGRGVVLLSFVLVGLVALVRRRIDVLAVGALASGVLVLLIAGQSGVVATRYYIPAYALFAVALVRALAFLPASVQAAGVAAAIFAFIPLTDARSEVRTWVDEEERAAALVHAVADVDRAGCVVAAAGLDLETREALPVLLGLQRPPDGRGCSERSTYFVVGPGDDARPLLRTCAPGQLDRLVRGNDVMTLYRCGRLRREPVRDPLFGPVEPGVLVAIRRFHPARETG
jgi:hypothetical protein